jgi:hypothetical protein
MTTSVSYNERDIFEGHPRRKIRDMSQADFIENLGSGTLRKSHKLGFDIQDVYLQERTRFEFGLGFEIIQRSRVTYTDIKLVSHQAMTELGWHAERMIEMRPFDSDKFVCKQLDIEYPNEVKKQGYGIFVAETSCPWLPKGFIIFSLVVEVKNGKILDSINPF